MTSQKRERLGVAGAPGLQVGAGCGAVLVAGEAGEVEGGGDLEIFVECDGGCALFDGAGEGVEPISVAAGGVAELRVVDGLAVPVGGGTFGEADPWR